MTNIIKYRPISLYRPLSVLRNIQEEMNTLFERTLGSKSENVFPEDTSSVLTSHWTPYVDIKEEPEFYVISADIPGVDPKDIQLSMEDNILTIKGERNTEQKSEEGNYSRLERFSGSFYRRFSLPDNADGTKIQAKGKHGVLEVKIPKKEPNKPKRIEVKVEEDK